MYQGKKSRSYGKKSKIVEAMRSNEIKMAVFKISKLLPNINTLISPVMHSNKYRDVNFQKFDTVSVGCWHPKVCVSATTTK